MPEVRAGHGPTSLCLSRSSSTLALKTHARCMLEAVNAMQTSSGPCHLSRGQPGLLRDREREDDEVMVPTQGGLEAAAAPAPAAAPTAHSPPTCTQDPQFPLVLWIDALEHGRIHEHVWQNQIPA